MAYRKSFKSRRNFKRGGFKKRGGKSQRNYYVSRGGIRL